MMPFVRFGSKAKVRRVPDGDLVKRKCPECGKTTIFRECVRKKEYTVYSALKFWDSTSTVYVCEACSSVRALSRVV
ncbi:MAG TPA: hypothetical protein ENK57_15125 [Polyangiaceae bacterium]|nr:hypothetical protein [Polyangiaceae bacterium]